MFKLIIVLLPQRLKKFSRNQQYLVFVNSALLTLYLLSRNHYTYRLCETLVYSVLQKTANGSLDHYTWHYDGLIVMLYIRARIPFSGANNTQGMHFPEMAW